MSANSLGMSTGRVVNVGGKIKVSTLNTLMLCGAVFGCRTTLRKGPFEPVWVLFDRAAVTAAVKIPRDTQLTESGDFDKKAVLIQTA